MIKKCQRCGDCCKTDTLLKDCNWTIKLARIITVFIKTKSIKMISEKPACPFLKYNNKGKAKCIKYKNRPDFCRKYFCKKCY